MERGDPVEQRSVLYRSFNVKNPTGESHLKHGFEFFKEFEDGTALCTTLIYSHMSNIGYWLSLVSLFLEKRGSVHSEKLTTFEKSVVSTLSPVTERVSTSDDSEIRISKPSFP